MPQPVMWCRLMGNQRLKCKHTILNDSCIACAELFTEWEARLLDSDFKDIEQETEKLVTVSIWCSDQSLDIKQTQYYFGRMFECVNKEEFENEVHKIIMERRAEGAKIVEILRDLKKKGKTIHRETVRHIIRRYETKWGIRHWSLKQMNLKAPLRSSG